MQPTTRLCRAEVEAEFGRPEMNRRQRLREERILKIGAFLMARHGRNAVTFRMLAGSLRMSPTTLAWHYLDLDALLGEILRRYLETLHTLLGAVPIDAPCRQPLLRAAYLKAIQGPFGGLTPLHTLLTRDRHFLPGEEANSIELELQGLGELLAGDLGAIALDLLDRPWMTPGLAETLLETIDRSRHASPAEADAIQGATAASAEATVPEGPAATLAPPSLAPPSLEHSAAAMGETEPRPTGFHPGDPQDVPMPTPGSRTALTDTGLIARAGRQSGDPWRGRQRNTPGQVAADNQMPRLRVVDP